jgi:hypothetical protein
MLSINRILYMYVNMYNSVTAHNKEFNGSAALRALGEWLAPFYSPSVLARPSPNIGVMLLES